MTTAASAARVTREPRVRIHYATEMDHIHVPASAFTIAGFRAWATSDELPERLRVTFCDGEIFLDMSNEDPETHVGAKGEITRVCPDSESQTEKGESLRRRCARLQRPGGCVQQSRCTLLLFKSLRAGRVRLVPRENKKDRYKEILGKPDWMLEVISDSSVRKDTEKLRLA
jgi:Uma2 family endonuclease